MPLLVTRNGTDWVESPQGESITGPCWGFDSDNGTPVFRTPDGTWVNGMGESVDYFGQMSFSNPKNSAYWPLL